MSSQPPAGQPPASQPPAGQPPAGEPTVKQLADRQERVESKLDQVIGLLQGGERQAHDAAARHQEAKLNAPTDVAEEVRRQIAERDQAQASAAAADQAAAAAQSWQQGVDAKLAELTEKTPEAPVRRVERLFGWR